jgi:hypothetical protein
MPKCYWSGFQHDGVCTSSCPQDAVEIASSHGYCESGSYAAACCDPGTNSVALYHTCTWTGETDGDFTNCGNSDDTCPDGLATVAQSQSGSGEVQCNVVGVSMAPDHAATYSVRTYCCDNSDRNIKWGFCGKYGTDGNTAESPGYCPGDCPDGRYRVALDQHAPECSSGAASTCCVPTAQTLNTHLPEGDLSKAEALDLFLRDVDGYCFNDTETSENLRRELDDSTTGNVSGTAIQKEKHQNKRTADYDLTVLENGLNKRDFILQHPAVLSEVEELVTNLIDSLASGNQIDAWNSGIGEDYPFLQSYALEPYMEEFPNRTSFAHYGEYLSYHGLDYGGPRDIVCAPDYFNNRIQAKLGKGKEVDLFNCNCAGASVCGLDGRSCSTSDVDDDDGDRSELRIRSSQEGDHLNHLFARDGGGKKRPYEYNIVCADGVVITGTFYSFPVSTPLSFWRVRH